MCPRRHGALLCGPSTSPLDRTMRVTAVVVAVLSLGIANLTLADTPTTKPDPASAQCATPRLSQASAIRIALAHLKTDPSNYEPPNANCSVSAKGKTWSVYFQAKGVILDGCFWILIDDRTGKVDTIRPTCG